jgi:hypothetical protein
MKLPNELEPRPDRLRLGERVFDKSEPRHHGKVEAVARTQKGMMVFIRWDAGWRSSLPMEQVRRVSQGRG